jgi:hypothetical protein
MPTVTIPAVSIAIALTGLTFAVIAAIVLLVLVFRSTRIPPTVRMMRNVCLIVSLGVMTAAVAVTVMATYLPST